MSPSLTDRVAELARRLDGPRSSKPVSSALTRRRLEAVRARMARQRVTTR